MSNAKLPAPNDECAECGKHHSEHPEPHFWCDPADSDDFRVFTPKPLQVEGPEKPDCDCGHPCEGYPDTCGVTIEAGAEATTKPDYLNKTLRECSREELMEALRVTEEKNKAIDAKSRISPEALDVRAGAEATGKSDEVEQFKEKLRTKVKERRENKLVTVNDGHRLDCLRDAAYGNVDACDWFLKLIDELSNNKA